VAWEGSTRRATLPKDWPHIRRRILRRDGYLCRIAYPGVCLGPATQVDHIGDRNRHDETNLQAACAPCNQRKNILTRPKLQPRTRPAEPHPGVLPKQGHQGEQQQGQHNQQDHSY
jgi:5-methylcytosine-specific restriction endonuclease McrA